MTTTATILDIGRPKRDIIEAAFEECGSAGWEFERTAEEVTAALRKLNAMMAEWPWNQLGYAQPAYGVGLPEDLSGVPDSAVAAVSMYLAMRLAPGMGATIPPETKAALTRSYNLLVSSVSTPPTAYIAPNTPRGAGHKGKPPFLREGS